MASDLEQKAKEAFIDDHFELALELYNQAIDLNPNYAELYADRAQANIKLNNLTEAVADANKAIELEPSMSKAYLRKGVACMRLEEYSNAKAALEIGASLAQGEIRFTNLMKECDQHITDENTDQLKNSMENNNTTNVSTTDVQPENNVSNQATEFSVKPKYRHEFFQKPEEVVVTIFAKKIPAQNIDVDYGEQILSVNIVVPGEDPYHFQPRLFAKIIPAKCRYDVLSTKIEIRLAKAEPISWTSLEFSKEISVPQRFSASAVGSQRPDYPSSKPKKVDWDKLEAQIRKEEKDEKLDGDAALNQFFRNIFKDADEDARRAMQKSFVESNGTVLSTNWNEVGSKKVEGSPPDGMEVKKWEY